MRTIEQMIQSEVLCCMSSMVSTLAQAYGSKTPNAELDEMIEQAFELACPVPDYEEAAIQAGWSCIEGVWRHVDHKGGFLKAEEACKAMQLDPIDSEVFEHWAVSDWFADKLIAAGEKVDKDFAGLCVWARTTTGQAIYADVIIERIYAECHKLADADIGERQALARFERGEG